MVGIVSIGVGVGCGENVVVGSSIGVSVVRLGVLVGGSVDVVPSVREKLIEVDSPCANV